MDEDEYARLSRRLRELCDQIEALETEKDAVMTELADVLDRLADRNTPPLDRTGHSALD